MVLGARRHNHKDKLNKDTNNDTFGPSKKPVTPEDQKSMTSHLNVTKKRDHGIRKQR